MLKATKRLSDDDLPCIVVGCPNWEFEQIMSLVSLIMRPFPALECGLSSSGEGWGKGGLRIRSCTWSKLMKETVDSG